MAEEAAVVEPTAAEAEPMRGGIRPEARAALDQLSAKLNPSAQPAAQVADPTPAPAAPATVPAPAPVPSAPTPSDMPTLDDFITPSSAPAAPAPATTTTEFPPTDELFPEKPPVEIRSEKRKEGYAKQRETYENLHKRVRELEAQQSAVKPDEGLAAENQQLKSQLAQLQPVMERMALTERPAYIQNFEQPLAKLRESAVKIVKGEQIDPSEFDHVLSLSGNERIKALEKLSENIESPILRRKLERIVDDIDAKEGERGEWLANARTKLDQLGTEEKIARHEQIEKDRAQMTNVANAVLTHLKDVAKIPFFQTGEGPQYAAHNADVQKLRETVSDMIVNCDSPERLSGAIALGVAFPKAYQWGQGWRTRALTAERELAERKGASPDLSGSPSRTGLNGHSDEEDAGDMSQESIRRRLLASRR